MSLFSLLRWGFTKGKFWLLVITQLITCSNNDPFWMSKRCRRCRMRRAVLGMAVEAAAESTHVSSGKQFSPLMQGMRNFGCIAFLHGSVSVQEESTKIFLSSEPRTVPLFLSCWYVRFFVQSPCGSEPNISPLWSKEGCCWQSLE